MSDYRTTLRECLELIQGVCSHCGGPISAIETVDNGNHPTFWPGCFDCCIFDRGTDPEHYKIACTLFDDGERPCKHMDLPNSVITSEAEREYANYYRGEQVSCLCHTVSRVLCLAVRNNRKPTQEQITNQLADFCPGGGWRTKETWSTIEKELKTIPMEYWSAIERIVDAVIDDATVYS